MILCAEQIQTLEAYASDAFAKETGEHLKSFARKLCEVVGDPAVRQIAGFFYRGDKTSRPMSHQS
jgi:hypothetical protein